MVLGHACLPTKRHHRPRAAMLSGSNHPVHRCFLNGGAFVERESALQFGHAGGARRGACPFCPVDAWSGQGSRHNESVSIRLIRLFMSSSPASTIVNNDDCRPSYRARRCG